MGRSYGAKIRKNVQKCRLHQLRASISRERWHLWLSFFDRFRAKDQSYPTVYHFPRKAPRLRQCSRSLPLRLIKEYTLQLHNHSARLYILRISRVLSDPEILQISNPAPLELEIPLPWGVAPDSNGAGFPKAHISRLNPGPWAFRSRFNFQCTLLSSPDI